MPSAWLQSSHGEDTKYYDIGERHRSPPRYERSVLERLHGVGLSYPTCISLAVSAFDLALLADDCQCRPRCMSQNMFSKLLQGQTCLPEATRRTVARHIWHVQGLQAESSKVIPADTGWLGDDGDGSQSSSASSSAGSDNSVSPEMQRNTSLLLSRSMSLGGALLGRSSSGKRPVKSFCS